ncbi:fructosamine kinase family protein [Chitinophaga lutea]
MMDDITTGELAEALSAQLAVNIQINRAERIRGGDINETYRLETSQGVYFLKMNDARRFPDMFLKEYDGLEALRTPGVIDVPRPLTYGQAGNKAFLVTEFIEKGAAAPDFWEHFAAALARLHQCTKPFFGFNTANYIGSLKQYNTPYTSWPVYYAFNRVMPLVRMAYDNGKMDRNMVRQAEALCRRLPSVFPDEPPALLHGDLWSGNFLVAMGGKVCIFDPAVYYGHREMDMAMTRLFGGFDTRFYYTYQAIRPLESGWQQRIGICQLYPLLVHLNLFGGSYYNDVQEILGQHE